MATSSVIYLLLDLICYEQTQINIIGCFWLKKKVTWGFLSTSGIIIKVLVPVVFKNILKNATFIFDWKLWEITILFSNELGRIILQFKFDVQIGTGVVFLAIWSLNFSLRFFCTVVAPTCNRSVLWECQNFYKPLNSCSGPDLSLGSTGMLKIASVWNGIWCPGSPALWHGFLWQGFLYCTCFCKQYFLWGGTFRQCSFYWDILKLLSFIFL